MKQLFLDATMIASCLGMGFMLTKLDNPIAPVYFVLGYIIVVIRQGQGKNNE